MKLCFLFILSGAAFWETNEKLDGGIVKLGSAIPSIWKGECMQTINKEKLEMLRKRYPAGTKVCLDAMEGERQMESGLKGTVTYVDDIGQILVQWENGSSLSLIPGVDRFHKISGSEKKAVQDHSRDPIRKKEEPSR